MSLRRTFSVSWPIMLSLIAQTLIGASYCLRLLAD